MRTSRSVKDGHLVPAKSVSVPLRFQREGIRYEDLSEEEKRQWDEIEWDEEGSTREFVRNDEVNRWLFNKDTVDKVLKHLMEKGQKVAGGDQLGKTIVFAKNQAHAKFIEERFNENYPYLKGAFARVITFDTEYAQSLIDDFSIADKVPHIALSVDMLDTGIDVPEVVNLVFFKLVRSKTKFWQMVGRGTRLRPDLFGPGQDKKFFYIFDYCQNLEFFQQNPEASDGAGAMSLSKVLFTKRVELIVELDRLSGREPESKLRCDIAELLQTEVAAMKVENFIVRPKRRLVERYAQPASWQTIGLEQQTELLNEVAGLPTTIVDDDLEAKQFDLLMLRLQLTLLRAEPAYLEWRRRVEAIAGLLAAQDSIPMIRAQMPLILSLMSEEFWLDVTTPILESVRKQIRALVKLIEKVKRKIVYTDFEDELGEGTEIDLPGFITPLGGYEKFRAKAQQFLKEHQDLPAIVKVKTNQSLTAGDLNELERILLREGIGTLEDLMQAKEASQGLGLFIRSLVGLDRAAAKAEFDRFIEGKRPSPNQLRFIDWIINYLTENGFMEASRLYESPFTDLNSRGVEGMFLPDQVNELVGILETIRTRAAAA